MEKLPGADTAYGLASVIVSNSLSNRSGDVDMGKKVNYMLAMLYMMNSRCNVEEKHIKSAIIMQQVLQLSPHVFPYKPYIHAMLLQQPLLHLHTTSSFYGHEYGLLLTGKTGAKRVYDRTPNVGFFRPPLARAQRKDLPWLCTVTPPHVVLFCFVSFRFVSFRRFGIAEMREHSIEKFNINIGFGIACLEKLNCRTQSSL
jgi:hypothetical protein